MEVLNDTTTTRTVHTRTVDLSNAPTMKTNNFYNPDQMWQPDKLTVEWENDEQPVCVVAEGVTDDRLGMRWSYGWEQMPEWMAEVVKPKPVAETAEAAAPLVKPKLTRKRVGDRTYDIYTKDGKLVGHAAQTGEHGRDNYPWDWYLTDDLSKQLRESDAPKHHKSGGSSDSLRDIIDMMASKIARYDLKP